MTYFLVLHLFISLVLTYYVGLLINWNPIFVIFWFVFFYGGNILYERWNLYSRSIAGMSQSTLTETERYWRKGNLREGSPISHLRRKGDHLKTIIGLSRILEMQEELLKREKLTVNQKSNIDDLNKSIFDLKTEISYLSRVSVNKESLAFPTTITENWTLTLFPETVEINNQLISQPNEGQFLPSPSNKKAPVKQRKKSIKTLFFESYETYLYRQGKSVSTVNICLAILKSSENIKDQSEGVKEKLIFQLYEYADQASEEDIEVFKNLINALIEQLSNA